MGHKPSVFDMAMSYQNKSNMIFTYAGILLILKTIKTSIKRKKGHYIPMAKMYFTVSFLKY